MTKGCRYHEGMHITTGATGNMEAWFRKVALATCLDATFLAPHALALSSTQGNNRETQRELLVIGFWRFLLKPGDYPLGRQIPGTRNQDIRHT